ncbi:ATPase family associated with various cellular activities (AAA) [Gimesia maris]|uniref:ATP-binding protein n=1 Tax=Gimesia maris TaxID=122 RepID=UPI00118851C9|nr:ATP-binding protein [Gimesia maris]QDU12456.1 ATPase family associated with various cellular activities (AAA) [Gimesia maris]
MSRIIIESNTDALTELDTNRKRPEWYERDLHLLPFSKLTGDEFEVLCFLLLKEKHPNDRVYYYGKTSDMGRDIIHVSASGDIRLIQCKNFTKNVNLSDVATEMAKVYANVHSGKIPQKPDEVVFFVASDLSATVQDLLGNQSEWIKIANERLQKFLKTSPSDELKQFARDWWPFGDRQTGIAITEDVKKYHSKLIEDFFSVHKVIDATRSEVRQDVREELYSAFEHFSFSSNESDSEKSLFSPPSLSSNEIRSQFILASKSLTNWPRTLADSQWIKRPEINTLLSIIETDPYYSCVLLGEPGSGKSALLAQLAKCLDENGFACLGIKADTLDVNVDTLGKLAERLQLPATVADCVMTIAQEHKVVVLIDQLDALADLVDLRSERLNVLLNLIHQLAETSNVYIIASSREFEFNHDSRFQTIQAEQFQLELPSWESVNEVLKQLKIDGANWPDSFKEILRTPQNLKIFVEHLNGTTEQKVFASYQEMLEELWYQKVTRSTEASPKKALLGVVTEEMSDREELWIPIARFDDQRTILDHLVADGILKISENRFQFGFQHQTLFSHARARAVVQGDIDLCDFVIERQHALFVRPTLWSTLGYLREASRETYTIQMGRLCTEPLRFHIRHLLLDFLGRLEDPDDIEEAWLVNWLEDDDFKRRAIISISNSTGWFSRLKNSQITLLMQNSSGIEWQLVGLLSVMINRLPEETLDLLEQSWLNDSDKDEFTFRIFDQFTHWSEMTVATVCQIIDRTQITESFVTDIATNVAEHQPELAPGILATEFRKQMRAVQSLPEHQIEKLPPEASHEEQMIAIWRNESKNQFRELLESSSGRFGMDAIAEAAPLEFLNQMWPLFLEALEPTLDMPHHILNRFRASSLFNYEFDREYSSEKPLLEAIRTALRELGNSDSTAFENFVRSSMNIDAILVQRLLCRSLVELDTTLVELPFDFLTSDPRRLLIGDYDDYHKESRKLITKLAPKLSAEQLHQLEQSINNWTKYNSEIPDQTAEDKRDRLKWDRESRLRLLMAIPKHLLSEKSKLILEAEEVALPTVKARLEGSESRIEMTRVVSPMSTEQMRKAKDTHILKLFDELTDDTDWDHPRRGLRGGTIEASRALAESAKENPERAAELATQFRSTDQQIPAAHIVEAISKSDYPTEKLFDLIRDLVKLGFNSQHFQDTVASACARSGDQLDGLPDDLCELLTSWLENWNFPPKESIKDEDLEESKENEKHSILFDQQGVFEIPQGTYSILSAIAFGLIRKKPPATEDWLTVLNRHLEHPEKQKTWQVFSRELRMLRYCDQTQALSFVERLFEKYPRVRDSLHGVHLIAYLRDFIAEEAFTKFSDQIADSNWTMGIQAKGELYGYSYLAKDDFHSVNEFIELTTSAQVEADNRLLTGIAFAVANLWKEGFCQLQATELFEKLVERKCPPINQALDGVFLSDQFVPNRNSKRILHSVTKNPEVIQNVSVYHFAEMLELFVASEPGLVLKLSNILLDQLELNPKAEFSRNFDLSDPALTSIAITLQRTGGHFRGDGLDLFERLLRLGFSSTIQTMNELDNRPVNVVHRARRRKRKKNNS